MITEEEKQEIINLAVEKALLLIPETVGNMIANHASLNKINSEFYTKYPEFKNHKQLVASVIEMVEGKNTFASYDRLLELAVPEIRKRITSTSSLNFQTDSIKPNTNFSKHNVNGEI